MIDSNGRDDLRAMAHGSVLSPARVLSGRRLVVGLALLGAGLAFAVGLQAQAPDTEPTPAGAGARHTAAILPLQGEITNVMVDSLRRRIAEAVAQGAKVIVLDMDTPGGLVSSSIAIADLLKNLPDVKTVAWVNPNAHSGGSIVAVACDEIVMARSARMGDSQVIMGGPAGASAVPEELQPKAYTPVLAEFRASATLNSYSHVLSEAFVLPNREVWWIEHIETGEKRFVFRRECIKLVGSDDVDTSVFAVTPSDEDDATYAWKLVETYHDSILDRDVRAFQPVVSGTELLEMSSAEARAYGFSKGIVANEDDLRARYDLGRVFRLDRTWSESLAYWMTSIYVRGFLMVIIMLGAYVEFHTPGVGVPGMVALIALTIFVGAPYMTGLANVWEIVLIVLGVILLAVEMFVIPGFGVAGIAGLVLIAVGVLTTFVPDEPGQSFPLHIPEFDSTMERLKVAIVTMSTSAVVSVAGMVMLSRYLPRVALFRAIIPENPTPAEVTVDDPYHGLARVGDRGVSKSRLVPGGKALFDSLLVDVVTEGDYVEPGTALEVIERHGNQVTVRVVSS